MNLMNNNVYVTQLRRTKEYGELQPDVWAEIQGPFVKLGEISKNIEPDSFLDASFIPAANNWTLEWPSGKKRIRIRLLTSLSGSLGPARPGWRRARVFGLRHAAYSPRVASTPSSKSCIWRP
jgi:hypothetical protein